MSSTSASLIPDEQDDIIFSIPKSNRDRVTEAVKRTRAKFRSEVADTILAAQKPEVDMLQEKLNQLAKQRQDFVQFTANTLHLYHQKQGGSAVAAVGSSSNATQSSSIATKQQQQQQQQSKQPQSTVSTSTNKGKTKFQPIFDAEGEHNEASSAQGKDKKRQRETDDSLLAPSISKPSALTSFASNIKKLVDGLSIQEINFMICNLNPSVDDFLSMQFVMLCSSAIMKSFLPSFELKTISQGMLDKPGIISDDDNQAYRCGACTSKRNQASTVLSILDPKSKSLLSSVKLCEMHKGMILIWKMMHTMMTMELGKKQPEKVTNFLAEHVTKQLDTIRDNGIEGLKEQMTVFKNPDIVCCLPSKVCEFVNSKWPEVELRVSQQMRQYQSCNNLSDEEVCHEDDQESAEDEEAPPPPRKRQKLQESPEEQEEDVDEVDDDGDLCL